MFQLLYNIPNQHGIQKPIKYSIKQSDPFCGKFLGKVPNRIQSTNPLLYSKRGGCVLIYIYKSLLTFSCLIVQQLRIAGNSHVSVETHHLV